METKLTLRMDEKLIHSAKAYARDHGMSLSKLVSYYLRTLLNKNGRKFDPTPILSEISGVLRKTSTDRDLREEYNKYLEEKYL